MSPQVTTLTGRSMYIWKLRPVLVTEMGVNTFVRKAKRAKFSSVWIKVAEGDSEYGNITGAMEAQFTEVCQKLKDADISVWGWHVPYCRTSEDAKAEARLVNRIAQEFALDGILMDAESEAAYFKGDATTADAYASELRRLLTSQGKGMAISSHDVPTNFPGFPFDAFAKHATVNAPQVYYGGSPSVENRLDRAIRANRHLDIPFVPVGAGWLGGGGGCSSASACAERAIIFMRLVREHGFPGYSFWHWQGAPSKLWEVLFTESV